MDNNIFVSTGENSGYEIMLRQDFDSLAGEITELGFAGRKIGVISDDNVFPLYKDKLKKSLKDASDDIFKLLCSGTGSETESVSQFWSRHC